MVVINKQEFDEIVSNELAVIVLCCGGLGNYIGAFLSALDFYYKYNLNVTHKFVCISRASNNADMYITDIFDFNDNIILMNSKDYSKIKYSDNIWQPLHPYNHTITLPPSDINTRSMFFSTNQLNIENYDNLIIAKNNFQIKIRENIEQKITSFVKNNKVDKNTLGIHFRGTDRIHDRGEEIGDHLTNFVNSCKSRRYRKHFICSDEPNVEKELTTIFKGTAYNKNTKVLKVPGFENSDWRLNADEQKLAYELYKISNVCNIYRSLEQSIDGFIDAGILGHCTIIHNLYSSTFDDLADGIFKLFFTH